MININVTWLLALLTGSSLTAFSQEKSQSVIASAGGSSKGGTIILEWTVGETAIETISSASSLYTQGFHQPLLQVHKLAPNKEVSPLKGSIQVYPNPATAVINIQLDKLSESGLLVSLIDANGRVVLNNLIPANSNLLKINVSKLSQGAYLLRITNSNGTAQRDYKIIKVQ